MLPSNYLIQEIKYVCSRNDLETSNRWNFVPKKGHSGDISQPHQGTRDWKYLPSLHHLVTWHAAGLNQKMPMNQVNRYIVVQSIKSRTKQRY